MSDFKTVFSAAGIDRCGTMRADPQRMAAARDSDASRFLLVCDDQCLAEDDRAAMLSRHEINAVDDTIFLGRLTSNFLFAIRVEDAHAVVSAGGSRRFSSLRELAARLPEQDAALLGYARAMVTWQDRHRHCGVCGGPNVAREGGFVMTCTTPGCGHRSFPRLDPAIIVLVRRGDACLLGRQQTWPENRFSTIAGFVEPGESLEEAVRREVHEETNVRVGHCEYLGSQPWPFPSALMLGFHADAESEVIRLNDAELAEARWVTREQIRDRAVLLPPRASIAWRLIERWFDDGNGPPLGSLDGSG